ncbi:T9SS type A sorting domain-containing protein [Desulfosarcina sp.]|nr:T9SS type A sorting domain-containing protein [Desulfosarcina sp.]
MKKILLFAIAIIFGLFTFGQQRALVSKEIRNKAVLKTKAIKDSKVTQGDVVPQKSVAMVKSANDIGNTWYDVQSNRGVQDRIYLYDDGTIGAVWTRGPESQPSGNDRGTGYNYFDGSAWGPYPEAAIEEGARAGWPAYTSYGLNGEAYTCHDYFDGTILGTRDVKGEGEWNLVIQGGPTGVEDISFPRLATSGENNDLVHLLSTTWSDYNGQANALLYARTADAGFTWEVENQLFDDLGPDFSLEIGGDVYEWAEPRNGLLAFTVGDNWMDFVLMKSDDEGESWDKTVVWECSYPLWELGMPIDTFYCPDGAQDLAIDADGKVHIVFGLTRAIADEAGGQSYYPGVDGVVYWNEDRPSFSNDIDALSPIGDENSELVENYSLIGWSQDIDGNGTIDIIDDGGAYNTGLSSQPQIVVDEMNQIFVVYSSVTEGYDNGTSNYRHLWSRASMNGGEWWGDFTDLTGDIIYSFDESAFPSASSTSDDNIHITYQVDDEPGTLTDGIENTIRYMSLAKSDLLIGIEETEVLNENNVSQNYPNPFSGTSSVFINLDKAANLELIVTNIVGQRVYTIPEQQYNKGRQKMLIDASGFPSGVYFYTINSGDNSVTKKMIVE